MKQGTKNREGRANRHRDLENGSRQKNSREIKKNAVPEHKSLHKGDDSKKKNGEKGRREAGERDCVKLRRFV